MPGTIISSTKQVEVFFDPCSTLPESSLTALPSVPTCPLSLHPTGTASLLRQYATIVYLMPIPLQPPINIIRIARAFRQDMGCSEAASPRRSIVQDLLQKVRQNDTAAADETACDYGLARARCQELLSLIR